MIFELPGWERPRSLQLQVSRLVCSNYRSTDGGSRADLAACLEKIQSQGGSSECGGGLCFASTFPAREDDLSPISETLLKHATQAQPPPSTTGWKRDLLWSKETEQVWFIHLDPFWADFFVVSGQISKTKPLPFIGTVPITAWIQPDQGFISILLSFTLEFETNTCTIQNREDFGPVEHQQSGQCSARSSGIRFSYASDGTPERNYRFLGPPRKTFQRSTIGPVNGCRCSHSTD